MTEAQRAAARDRLHSLAQPCLVLGLVTVVLAGALHLAYRPDAVDFDLLTVEISRMLVVGAALWLLPHAAALWWLRRGGAAPFLLFVTSGVVGAVGVSVLLWSVTLNAAGAVAGLLIGGHLFVLELAHAWRAMDRTA